MGRNGRRYLSDATPRPHRVGRRSANGESLVESQPRWPVVQTRLRRRDRQAHGRNPACKGASDCVHLPRMSGLALQGYLESDSALAAAYEKIRTYAGGIVISGYDLTKRCNLRCEGCFFFEGELSVIYPEAKTDGEYDAFFADEVRRGVNYPHFAGAEPALVQQRLRIAARHW